MPDDDVRPDGWPDDGTVTVSELGRTLGRIEVTLDRLDAKIERAHDRVDMLDRQALDRRLAAMETFHAWLIRTVIGAVVLAVLSLVLSTQA